MRECETFEHPDVTRALIKGGCYWDEKSELEWEKYFSKEPNMKESI